MIAIIVKTIAKASWFMATYTIIFGIMFQVTPLLASLFPPVEASRTVMGIFGSVVSTLSWLFSDTMLKFALYSWLLFPFIKFPIYVHYKVTHL